MKNLPYILPFLLLPIFGLAQEQELERTVKKEQPTTDNYQYKNQIDLDVYLIGVEASYKRRLSSSFFLGIGIGGLINKVTLNEDFALFDGFLEVFKVRPFMQYKIGEKFHIETGFVAAGTISIDDDDTGYSTALELGVFFGRDKILIGFRPSLLYYNGDSPIITTSLLIIKVPLKKW